MSNQQVAAQPFQQQRGESELQHAIKRNIGSSTTSLTAFSLSQQPDKLRLPVSLSPFEYASPLGSHSNLHSLHHSATTRAGYHQQKSLESLDSEDLDFDTAYNIINDSINNNFQTADFQQRPRTPDQNLHTSLKYKSPNQQLKFHDENDEIYQDHRRAIIQAGLQMHPNQQQYPGLQQQQQPTQQQQQQQQHQTSPFSVSPHTRNLLHSVNNMATAYQLNNSGYELLSITESSALEKFLDSVVDDSRLSDLGRHWPSIDPLAKSNLNSEFNLPTLVTEGNNKVRLSQIPDLKLQKINTDMQSMHPIPANHVLPLSYLLSPLQSPLPNLYNLNSNSPSLVVDDPTTEPIKKKRGRKKKVVVDADNDNNDDDDDEMQQQYKKKPKKETSLEFESAASKVRRLILTEEQKKQNHTESEKKRRAMIKTSYDKLLDTLKADKCYYLKYGDDETNGKKAKRGNSRSAVMNCVINEIEWLVNSNKELKRKLQS